MSALPNPIADTAAQQADSRRPMPIHDAERRHRQAIEAGAQAAAQPRWAGSSKLTARIARGAVAQHELALLLSREGRHGEANAQLHALQMKHKLSPAILSPSPGPKGKRARAEPEAGAPLVFDGVLPDTLLAELQLSLRPGAAFWCEHGYPTPCFFSYRHELDAGRPALLQVEQAARLLLPLVQKSADELHGGSAPRLKTVEWWAHCRGAGQGHQLHYDLDEATLLQV